MIYVSTVREQSRGKDDGMRADGVGMLIKLDIKLRINIKEKLKLQIQIQNNFGNKNFSKKFTQNTFQIIDRKQQKPMQVI